MPIGRPRVYTVRRKCDEPGCYEPAFSKCLCEKHYQRQYARTPKRAEQCRQYNRKKRTDPQARALDKAKNKAYLEIYSRRPEVVDAKREYMAGYSKRYHQEPCARESYAAASRKYRTGFTRELVQSLRDLQQGRCAVCSVVMELSGIGAKRECADHHEPQGIKTPRGLLCNICNTALGAYEKHQRAYVRFPHYEAYLEYPPAARLLAKGAA